MKFVLVCALLFVVAVSLASCQDTTDMTMTTQTMTTPTTPGMTTRSAAGQFQPLMLLALLPALLYGLL
jgi:hypothetical protein